MYYVYFLQSKHSPEVTYVGFTRDLKNRLIQHNNLESISTKKNAPWELVYYEDFKSKEDAAKRERMLKYDGKAKTLLKKRIENCLSLKGAA